MLLLVTGASGVGKSTVRTVVAPELAPASTWAGHAPVVLSGWQGAEARLI